MNIPKHMKMSELSSIVNVPAHTIRNYVRKGLLPKPIKTGVNMAYYTTEHIEALKKIHLLKEKRYSNEEMKKIMSRSIRDTHSKLKTETIYSTKRASIIKAAVSLFREKGYENTNIEDIVKYAGIGKNTFYQYFKSMQNLFFESTQSLFFDVTRDYPSVISETDGVKRLWNRVYYFTYNQRHLIDMLCLARGAFVTSNDHSLKVSERDVIYNLVEPIYKDLVQASEQGIIHFKDLRALAFFLMGAVEYTHYFINAHPGVNIASVLQRGWDTIFTAHNHHYTAPKMAMFGNIPKTLARTNTVSTSSKHSEDDLMEISELSRRANIPISRIRYYLLQELLPKGIKTSKTRAYYSSLHLHILNLIQRKHFDEKKPLELIRKELKTEVSLPKEENYSVLSSDKKEHIVSVATILFLKKGYTLTNTADIAREAKISKETIYKHYSNKEEIFMACVDKIFFRMYGQVWKEIKTEKNRSIRLFKRATAFFSSYPQWIQMMNLMKSLSVGHDHVFKAKFYQTLQQMMDPIIKDYKYLRKQTTIRKNIDSDLAAYMFMGMTEYGAWLIQNEHYSQATIMEMLNAIFYEGIPVKSKVNINQAESLK